MPAAPDPPGPVAPVALRWRGGLVAGSVLVALVAAGAAAAALARPDLVYPTAELRDAYLGTDAAIMILGAPALLVVAVRGARGGVMAMACWPGVLFFFAYIGFAQAFGMPQGWSLLVRIVLLSALLCLLAAVLAGIDRSALQARLLVAYPRRSTAAILLVLGTLFWLQAAAMFGGAVIAEEPLARTELAVVTADLQIAPAFVIVGIAAARRAAFGTVAGPGLLVAAGMLFVSLAGALALQPILTGAAPAWIDGAVVAGLGLLCLAPVARLMLRLRADPVQLQP